MDIGKELFIKVKHGESLEVQTYKCSIIDKNNDFLYIDQPIQMETKRTLALARGAHFVMYLKSKDNNLKNI